jgi:cholesterol transport system auxiliary component
MTLSACSVFSPVKSESPTTYLITSTPYPAMNRKNNNVTLLVSAPEGNAIYNTSSIAYTTHPYQIGYFVKSAWAETPTQMLQPLIVRTLQRTHYFHQVGTSSSLNQYGYILNTHLIQLEQDFSRVPHVVHLVLRAEVINVSNNQILGSKEFTVDELITRNDTYTGVIATNHAVSRVLNQLANFTVKTLKKAT